MTHLNTTRSTGAAHSRRRILDSAGLRGFALVSALAVVSGLVAGAAVAAEYPSERLNVTVAFGPGGGNDILSRTVVGILEKYKLYPKDIVVTNKPGGSGAVGWGFVFNQKGNPYHLSTNSGSFITTPLQANTPWKTTSFTPIALVATDDLLLLVNGKSDIKDLKTFIDRAKAKPPSIGGIGAVNVDFIIPKVLSEKANFKLASGNVGVMAATNEAVSSAQFPILAWVFAAVIVLCLVTYRSIRATLCILIPLALVFIGVIGGR